MEPVHFSTLKQIAKSPLHYQHSLRRRDYESRAMRVGTAAHALVLGGHYEVFPGDRRGKAWTEFKDEHPGCTILTATEDADARAVADAVLADRNAAEVLAGTEKEVSLEWQYLGRDCAGRLDAMKHGVVVDLKTTSCAAPWKFVRHALSYGYHAQLAWYLNGQGWLDNGRAFIIAVESSAPYAVQVFELTMNTLDAGARLMRLWMEKLLACEQANEWPAYCQGILPLDVPDTDDMSLVIDGEEVDL